MNERLESMSKDKLIRLIVLQVGALDQAKAEAAECRDMAVAALDEQKAALEKAITLANEVAGLERRLTLELKRSARLCRELTRRTRQLLALEKESRRWQ